MSKKEILKDHPHKKSNIKSQELFEKERIWKLLLRMAVPTVLMFLFMSLYLTVDTILSVSYIPDNGYYDHIMGAEKSSDVVLQIIALSAPIIAVAFAVQTLFNIGAEIRYSADLAKNDHKGGRETLGSSFTAEMIWTLFIYILLVAFGHNIVESIAGPGTQQEVIDEAYIYLITLGAAIPSMGMYDFFVRIFRVEGKVGYATLIGIIGIPINLIMDVIFMKYMGMGVAGAGVASFIGYSFQAIIGFILALKFKSRGETNIFYNLESFKIKKDVLIVTLLMGAPFILRLVLVNVDNIMYVSSVNNGLGEFDYNAVLSSSDAIDFQTQLNEYVAKETASGTGVTAAQATSEFYTNFWGSSVGAYGNTYTILWMTITGLIQGTTSVLTYNYNQQNYSRTKQSTKLTLLYMVILATFMIALFEILLPQILMIFKVTIINSANIYFVGVSLSRMIFVGLTFIPFIFILGTGNVIKSVVYTTIEGVWFIIILLVFDSTMSDSLNYYQIIPWTFAIAELSFIVATFPYYFYKVHHLHRDDELNKIKRVAKDFSSLSKMSINKSKLALETKYSNEVKHQVNEYIVENDIDSNLKTKMVYRNIYKVNKVNKGDDTANDLYIDELNKIWKDGSKEILDVKETSRSELSKLKVEESKKFDKWVEEYGINFVFKFAFTKDKSNSKEAGQFSQEKEFLEYEKEVSRREKELEKKQKLEIKELPKEQQDKINKENKKESYIAKKDDKIAVLYATLEGSKILFKDKYYDRKRIFDDKLEDVTNSYKIKIKKIETKILEDSENLEKYRSDIANLESEMDKEILGLSMRHNKRDISRKFDEKYEKASKKNVAKIEKLKSYESDYKKVEKLKIIEAKRDINIKLTEIKYNTKRYLNEN